MLINDFFKIINIEHSEGSIHSMIQLNASHKIFEGHFPNNPVTPGVVQLQIVKEILEQALDKKCLLKEVGRCKFLAILNPNNTPEIMISIDYSVSEDEMLKVSAQGSLKDESQTFFKFNAKYV